ncbi:hypothetical protein MNEG_0522 [Monoraphidium neglectum]|uniref:Plastid lipid-associated protein/fibrillin conserved domain-containing protein n=1 Tax=Monoraphidium neglectum TaxID=145388 RepID=A0A0D2MY70_9CHLO|nr:hypothetical protein MNEG_0522 [Monoraphidium neglectum]KIZ07425.1 hypothetical protein MNEG_0522 [Monoraphidium neglectum]|eukprot:XP_013906444.1 hypothetical protein MNEG_0522 [Monoraphidium neglectum]
MRSVGALAECSTSYAPQAGRRALPSAPRLRRPRALRLPVVAALAAAADAPPSVETAKARLLQAVEYTRRGANTTQDLRGDVEEAQVALESLQPGDGLDYALLEGKWRLVYTTAADVVPIVGLDLSSLLPAGLPAPVVVGDVFQRFSSVEEGRVDNIVEFGLPPLTQGSGGVTFTVGASYEVRSPRRISLTFLEAQVGRVRASPLLEALLAPALLPRGWWNQRALLAIKEFNLRFPFRSAQQVAAGRAVGAGYLLTYLDSDVLIGRAQAPGGSFIFVRSPE